MVAFIGLLSLFGFFACIVMAIINAIRKKTAKPVAITPDYHTNQLEAYVLSGWKEENKGSTVFINVDDLKIIY